MTKTLTVQVEEDLLRKAERTAAEERRPLSQWLTEVITRAVNNRPDRDEARRRALQRLRQGFALGGTALTREEAHERKP